MNKIAWNINILLLCSCLFFSCTTYKNIAYFKDVPDSTKIALQNAPFKSLQIRQGDILTINIMTIDPAANAIFNQGISSQTNNQAVNNSTFSNTNNATQQPTVPVYVVDKNGGIELPLIGKFTAENLTTDSLRNLIQEKTAEFYKMPAVIVRFANLKVSVLGEVLHPGTYILPNEKNTLLDAISMAGDLTIFGKRDNVVLIRDSSGYNTMQRFSLNKKDLVKKDFFYLKQNDVIYVEPTKAKAATLDADKTRMYAISASILSVLIVLLSRF